MRRVHRDWTIEGRLVLMREVTIARLLARLAA
jgi:hypothetical protein